MKKYEVEKAVIWDYEFFNILIPAGEIEEIFVDEDGEELDYQTFVYEWWNGHNFKKFYQHDSFYETVLEYSKEAVCLDEWDGQNFVTGGLGLHQYVHEIFSIDGSKVENKYLLRFESQHQGEHTRGEIMELEDIELHLDKLGRDVEEYINEIKNLF